jgi:hypothetical protein
MICTKSLEGRIWVCSPDSSLLTPAALARERLLRGGAAPTPGQRARNAEPQTPSQKLLRLSGSLIAGTLACSRLWRSPEEECSVAKPHQLRAREGKAAEKRCPLRLSYWKAMKRTQTNLRTLVGKEYSTEELKVYYNCYIACKQKVPGHYRKLEDIL